MTPFLVGLAEISQQPVDEAHIKRVQDIGDLLERSPGQFPCPWIRDGLRIQLFQTSFQQLEFSSRIEVAHIKFGGGLEQDSPGQLAGTAVLALCLSGIRMTRVSPHLGAG